MPKPNTIRSKFGFCPDFEVCAYQKSFLRKHFSIWTKLQFFDWSGAAETNFSTFYVDNK